jgi:hypothetical protein
MTNQLALTPKQIDWIISYYATTTRNNYSDLTKPFQKKFKRGLSQLEYEAVILNNADEIERIITNQQLGLSKLLEHGISPILGLQERISSLADVITLSCTGNVLANGSVTYNMGPAVQSIKEINRLMESGKANNNEDELPEYIILDEEN